jgi:SanA protein
MKMVNLSSRTWLKVALASFLAVLTVPLACHFWIERASASFCHSDLKDLPPTKAALVLGCSPTVQGHSNAFFTTRMDAAAKLYQESKVKVLIVSGDNGTHQYDEPTAMKDALTARGVPAALIFPDYAGFRTLDSVVRAKEVFGQSEFIIVSQKFHNERAVFLARSHGIKAHAFNAKGVALRNAPLTCVREMAARVAAVLDAEVLHTRPKFLGKPVSVP